jgi:hypothetical protein
MSTSDFRAWMEDVQARTERALERFLPASTSVPLTT